MSDIFAKGNLYKLDDLEFMQFDSDQAFEVMTVRENVEGGFVETKSMSLPEIENTDFSMFVDVDLFPVQKDWGW